MRSRLPGHFKQVVFPLLFVACQFMHFQIMADGNRVDVNSDTKRLVLDSLAHAIYTDLHSNKLDFNAFSCAYKGYCLLERDSILGNPDIITVIDFNKPSTQERLFVIDLQNRKIIKTSLVAHGKNSGDNYATKFSNQLNSNMSSLGFYVTGETYQGKHGLSLRLDGLEKNINDNARLRNIVIHSADYVNRNFIAQIGRLGRSFGCPALPKNGYQDVLNLIKNKTMLFIYATQQAYVKNSSILNAFY